MIVDSLETVISACWETVISDCLEIVIMIDSLENSDEWLLVKQW